MSYGQFATDRKTSLSVVCAIQNIGELVRDLPDELKYRHPNIPWKQITAIRNIAAHGYHNLDLDIIWDAAKNDIPILKKAVWQELESYHI